MSLQEAKKVADLKEQVAQSSAKLEKMHGEIRDRITQEVLGDFENHLSSNGFQVINTTAGRKASYKGLVIELKPEKEAYLGCYHAFSLFVGGKEIFVRVQAKFAGANRGPYASTSELEKLEKDLAAIEDSLNNRPLESYWFEAAVKTSGNQRPELFKKESISEVVDHFAS